MMWRRYISVLLVFGTACASDDRDSREADVVPLAQLTLPPQLSNPFEVMRTASSLGNKIAKDSKFLQGVAQAIDIAGTFLAITGLGGIVDGLLGAGAAMDTQQVILSALSEVDRNLRTLMDQQAQAYDLERLQVVATLRADALTGAQLARGFVDQQGRLPSYDEAQTMLAYSYSGTNALMDDSFWHRPENGRYPDGEYRYAVDLHPAGGQTFEWRGILPSFMHAVTARLTVLSAVYQDVSTDSLAKSELLGYRDFLASVRSRMLDGIQCGHSIWALEDKGTFRVHAICADTNTGLWSEVTQTGTIESDPPGCAFCRSTPHWAFGNGAQRVTHSAGRPNAADALATFEQLAHDNGFGDIVDHGLEDARGALRVEMGIFELERMIDALYVAANGLPDGRADEFRLHNFDGYNLCLNYAPGEVEGAAVVLGSCFDHERRGSYSWILDPVSGSIRNDALQAAGQGDWCLDVQWGSKRTNTPVQLWGCNGSDAQRWSLDAEAGQIRTPFGLYLNTTKELDEQNGSQLLVNEDQWRMKWTRR